MFLIRVLVSAAIFGIISMPALAQKIEQPTTRDGQNKVVINHEEQYSVVINHEEQYSIWQKGQKVPAGWKAIDFTGSKEESLRYIEEVWTDMRPLSSRREQALKIYQSNQRKK